MLHLARSLQLLHSQRQPFVLVTLTGIKGSAPQIEGAKMLVTASGLFWGTVGGGKIEAHSIRWAQEMLSQNKKSAAMTWNLQKDIGMSCGGEVSLFFDVNQMMNWNIAIFGAGHISQEVCRVLSTWCCQISVFDSRSEWLEKIYSSGNIDKKLTDDFAAEVTNLPVGTFLLSMTQGHASDVPVLHSAMQRPSGDLKFIGVIGSEVKARKIKSELVELGNTEEKVSQIVCPLGLPIGNNTPSEIAISIAAQLLAVRDLKDFQIKGGKYD